jgi:hypothetical protein
MKRVISGILSSVMVATILISTVIASDKINSKVIIDGGWGKSVNQFGRNYDGKTMNEYELSLLWANNEIYLLDSINDRIQVFSCEGNFKRNITLNTSWSKVGLYKDFSLYKDSFYMLLGKPPYYSDNGIVDIQKFSVDGKYISTFGNKFISVKTEEYGRLFSDAKLGYLYVSVGGKKVLAINEKNKLIGQIVSAKKGEVVNLVGVSPSGNPIVTVSKSDGEIVHTIIIDKDNNKIINTVTGRYSMTDDKGKFIAIRTLSASKRKNKPMLTMIEVFDSVTNKKEVFELTGDIHINKNGREKVYKLAGGHFEMSRMDADGAIYHLLALNDGVIVRMITIN